MEQYAVSPLPESSGIDLLETPENENTKNIQDKNDGESNGSILNEIVSIQLKLNESEQVWKHNINMLAFIATDQSTGVGIRIIGPNWRGCIWRCV